MKPSSEVGEASAEEMGIGETMEVVVTTMDAMTSAVEAVDAMVTSVEMREWLEEGRTETERITAVRFFSRALAWTDYNHRPLHWPGRLPGLVQLLGDCLLPHNSKAIKSGAIFCIQYFTLSCHMRDLLEHESNGHDNLIRLVRESDCLEIRDQAVWLLGRIFLVCDVGLLLGEENSPSIITSGLAFLPITTRLIRKYAVILKPTEMELSCLIKAIDALCGVCPILPFHLPQFIDFLPVLAGIFKEPGNRKEAQIPAGKALAMVAPLAGPTAFLESGVVRMLLETLRVGEETTAVLVNARKALAPFLLQISRHNGDVMMQKALDMGLLDAIYQVLKRPNDCDTERAWWSTTLWEAALKCLLEMTFSGTIKRCEAILDHKGLMELVLELSLGMDMAKGDWGYHFSAIVLLHRVTEKRCANLIRKLMSKESVFPLLSRFLDINYDSWAYLLYSPIETVEGCLALAGSERELHIRRRLADSSGITDVIRRISLSRDESLAPIKEMARNILDTYLTNPLPPLPPHNLPTIIYTRNAQP